MEKLFGILLDERIKRGVCGILLWHEIKRTKTWENFDDGESYSFFICYVLEEIFFWNMFRKNLKEQKSKRIKNLCLFSLLVKKKRKKKEEEKK